MKTVLFLTLIFSTFSVFAGVHVVCGNPQDTSGLQKELLEWQGYGYRHFSEPFVITGQSNTQDIHRFCIALTNSPQQSSVDFKMECDWLYNVPRLNAFLEKTVAEYKGNAVVSAPTGYNGIACVLVTQAKEKITKITATKLTCGFPNDVFDDAIAQKQVEGNFDEVKFGSTSYPNSCVILVKH